MTTTGANTKEQQQNMIAEFLKNSYGISDKNLQRLKLHKKCHSVVVESVKLGGDEFKALSIYTTPKSRFLVLPKDASSASFAELSKLTPDHYDKVKVFGKVYNMPRKQRIYCDTFADGVEKPQGYAYSGVEHKAEHGATPDSVKPLVDRARRWMSSILAEPILATTTVMNFYTEDKHKLGAHSDDEKDIDQRAIGSYTSLENPELPRCFRLWSKADKKMWIDFPLPDKCWSFMLGDFQDEMLHGLPWLKADTGSKRINLTIRIAKNYTESPKTKKHKIAEPTEEEQPPKKKAKTE